MAEHRPNIGLTDEGHFVEQLEKCLTEEQNSDKAPSGFDKALEAAFSSDTTSRIFLRQGFLTWYAYYLVTLQREIFQQLAVRLPTPSLERIAARLSRLTPHTSVSRRVNNILYLSNRAKRRRDVLIKNQVQIPPQIDRASHQLNYSPMDCSYSEVQQQRVARQSDPSGHRPALSTATASLTQDDGVCSHDSYGHQGTSDNELGGTIPFTVDPSSQYSMPSAKNLPFVFPNAMCTSIVTVAGAASLMVSFPSSPGSCRLVLCVQAVDVPWLAKEIFRCRIRERMGRRSIVFEHGSSLEINGSITLRGADSLPLEAVFGTMVYTAFQHAPRRMEELEMGQMLSDCLSMQVWEGSQNAGRFELLVEAKQLSTIASRLWGFDRV